MYSNVWVCFDDLSFTIGCWYALGMPGRPHAIQFDQRKWSWSWRPAERKPWVTCRNWSLLSRLYTYGNMVYVIKGSLVEKLPSYGGLTPPHSTHHSHHIAHHTSHITNIASHHITITSHHIIHITDITHFCVTTWLGDVWVSLFVPGAALGDVGASLFLAGAAFGEILRKVVFSNTKFVSIYF